MINDVDLSGCRGCGRCKDVCRQNVLEIVNGHAVINKSAQCVSCGLCVGTCPWGALSLDDFSTKQVLQQLMLIGGDTLNIVCKKYNGPQMAEKTIQVPCVTVIGKYMLQEIVANGFERIYVSSCNEIQCPQYQLFFENIIKQWRDYFVSCYLEPQQIIIQE